MKSVFGFAGLFVVASASLSAATFTVTNTDDTGPGSLRQALTDAQNCTGSPHTIAFDIPTGLLTGGVALLTPASALPVITCGGTTIDGTTQTANRGNTNDVTLGSGGTVGTGPDGVAGTGDEFVLPSVNGPEVELQGTSAISAGLTVGADGVTIRGLAIRGFTGNIVVGDVASLLIEANVLGAAATAFEDTGAQLGPNVAGNEISPIGSGAILRDNLIGFSRSTGIIGLGPGSLIEGNEIRGNGTGEVNDNIGAIAPPFTIQGNLIADSAGIGIDAGGDGDITISENTIRGNGFGSSTERCGIYIGANNGTISFNIISGNANVGVIPFSADIRLTRNSIHDNGTLGIDLGQPPSRLGDGVTPNDLGDADGGPNGRQNFPLIRAVEHLGPQGAGGTRITGSLHSAASTAYDIEFFENPGCATFPREFVEGETYLGSTSVTTDASGNALFDVTLPVATAAGARISATAADPTGNTSEFSQRIIFSISPASGPAAGGTALTALGTNFVDPTTMTIGGVGVPVAFVDSHTLGTTSPALAPGTFHDVVVDTTANLGVLVNGWVSDFLDVPGSHLFHSFVTTLVSNTITAGVGGGVYGVDQGTKRQQMAVFLLKAKHGLCYTPPPCAGTFVDVPCASPFSPWIEALAAEGITSGCGGDNFCPGNFVTRRQMAVFLLKTKYGSAYAPPPCTGVFDDVACPGAPAVDFIERLAFEQITGGCSTLPSLYCPDAVSTRGQMAVFIVKTFSLQ